MFKQSMQGISTLSLALMAEANELIAQNSYDNTTDGIDFISPNGDIYLPLCVQNDSSFPIFDFGENIHLNLSWDQFQEMYLGDNITTIAYNKSIDMIELLIQILKDEKVYGIVLEKTTSGGSQDSEKMLINPTHPINVFMLLAKINTLPDEGNIHIFEWSNPSMKKIKTNTGSDRWEKITSVTKRDYAVLFDKLSNIVTDPSIIETTASISTDTVTEIIDYPFLDILNAGIDVRANTTTISSKIKSLVVPTQLVLNGSAFPYYGMIFSDNPQREIRSKSITPMVSGNIQADPGYSTLSRFLDSSGETCTGQESRQKPRGWSTLSKINLDSMYYHKLIQSANVIPFVEASKSISLDLLTEYQKIQEKGE